MFSLAFMLPLIAGAAAPTVSFTSIEATAQTNYNGSVVTATFKGSFEGYTVALTVGKTSYAGTVSGDKVTFAVPGTAVTAGNIYGSTITATDNSGTYTIGGKYLYQGKPVAGGGGTNGWFKTWAKGATVNNEAGAWKVGDVTTDPPAADSKILIDENDDGDYEDFVFTPSAAVNVSQVSVVDMTLSFGAAMDETVAVAGAQAAIRVVTVGDTYRFAAVTNGVWTTNTEVVAELNTEYPVRMTVDYRSIPSITYAVKNGDTYQTIASGVSGTTKLAPEKVVFNGTGKLTVMTASNIVDSVDASLVKDGDGTKYANIDAATTEGKTDLTLLWNTAWTPVATVDGAWTIRGGDNNYQLYINPTGEGVWVKNNNGTWTVYANYYEVANLLFAASGAVTTNKYTYFTNAVVSGGAAITNLYLLHDVELGAALNVGRSMTFNGESNILSGVSGAGLKVAGGETFNIAGGCIGIPTNNCSGSIALAGGRFPEGLTNAWHSFLPSSGSGYVWAQLATPVRTVSDKVYQYQPMLSTIAPKANQELLPVTDANGESVSVVVNTGWAVEVTKSSDAATQATEFSKVQANGMTRFDNEVLGLAKDSVVTANNIPVITPHQSTSTENVTFSLGNVNQSTITASGAKVSYRVVTSSTPGGKDGAASTNVVSTATVEMPLPTSQEGVKYYIIEVDTGAVK